MTEENIPTEPVPTETVPDTQLHTDEALDSEKIDESMIPEKWRNMDIPSFINRGWQYRVKTKHNGTQFMCLRKGHSERGIGGYTPSKEKMFFNLYPELKEDYMRRKQEQDRKVLKRRRPYISVPIRRVAVIPADYRPSLNVIRYFHIFKKNGWPGDFSEFINGNVEDHFVRCNGIVLPVLLEELEEKRLIENVQ